MSDAGISPVPTIAATVVEAGAGIGAGIGAGMGAGVLGSESESANREVWSALSSSVSILDVDDTLGVERSCVDCGADEASTTVEGSAREEDVREEEEEARRSRWSRWSKRSGNACAETRSV